MPDPVSLNHLIPVGRADAGRPAAPAADKAESGDFAAALRQQLEQVSRMQSEADQGVQDLLTGRTQNVTEVFLTARKAQVAFGLLMEIRNKLVDAYQELRQLRV